MYHVLLDKLLSQNSRSNQQRMT